VTSSPELSPPNLRAAVLAQVAQALALFEKGQHLAAQPVAQRAVDLAREGADPPQLGAALTMLCRAEYMSGRHLQAFAAASEAYRLLDAADDLPQQVLALNVCAQVESKSGNTANAIDLWRKGLAAIYALRAQGRAAVGADTRRGEYVILAGLANCLSQSAEHRGAIEYGRAAVEVWRSQPQHAHLLQSAAATLAAMHTRYAEDLRRQGQHAEAAHQVDCATLALIAIDPTTWRSLDYTGLINLCEQTYVQAYLCDGPKARASAAAMLRATRQGTAGLPWRAVTFDALGELHWHAGRWRRALVYWQRSVQAHRQANLLSVPLMIFHRLIDAQAALGAFDAALALQKEYRALRKALHLQARALRVQIDVIERQNERRYRQAKDLVLHSQRLVVMGRLIAQTHHALHTPVAQARSLTAAALACRPAEPMDGPRDAACQGPGGVDGQRALIQLLLGLVQHVDRAAGLVNQLKLFTYRSSPEPTALLLHEVLRNEWQAITPQESLGGRELHIDDGPAVHAWADVQRAGILLRVLLIELTQRPGFAKLSARVEAAAQGKVLLHLVAGFAWPLVAVTADGAAAVATDPTVSLGLMLCQEIAVEMNGHLQLEQVGPLLRCQLQLPAASARSCTASDLAVCQ
jgi:tetratricopeptide (TPR) repeat protein